MFSSELSEIELQSLQSAVVEHFSKEAGVFGTLPDSSLLIEEEIENPLLNLDPNVKRFSLQDVTELTLLHAYQMQVLYADYE
jgi:hypothetical protein